MILALRAKILYELVCEESSLSSSEDEQYNDVVTVDLPGIDRDTFEAMLEHVYTVKQPLIEDQDTAKKLLVAADRFCLTDLKLYVESVLADQFVTPQNAASLLLFADSHSCALLKETTMDLYVSDPTSVIHTPGWAMVEESDKILSELLKHIHTGCRHYFYKNDDKNKNKSKSSNRENNEEDSLSENNSDDSDDEGKDKDNDLDRLDVFSLRERLNETGLDVDGSRETLVGRLRNLQEAETRE